MSDMTVNRRQEICALCKYWNGAIGSVSIRILGGGMVFRLDSREEHSCFKSGRGMQTNAMNHCPYFKPRYED